MQAIKMTLITRALDFRICLYCSLTLSSYCVTASYYRQHAASTALPDSMTLVSMEGLSMMECVAYCDRTDDCYSVSQTLVSMEGLSMMECVAYCDRTDDCYSVSHGSDKGRCLLSETTVELIDSLVVTYPGYTVFVKGMHVFGPGF